MSARNLSRWLLGALAALSAPPAVTQDLQRGNDLYQTNCLGCHYERIHDRDKSRSDVKDFAQLRIEIAKRSEMAGKSLTIADLDDIAEYLNRSHYRFRRP